MDIKNPEYILEIARQQSVTRAAEKLFVTQSTLSQYLLKLEAELGTPLFLRDKNCLTPTDAGRIYLQAAQDIVRIQDATLSSIASLKNEGCIRLGCSSWGLDLVANSLPAFKERFPSITLRPMAIVLSPLFHPSASLRAVLWGSRSISSNIPQDTSSGTSRNWGRSLRLDRRMFLLLSMTNKSPSSPRLLVMP